MSTKPQGLQTSGHISDNHVSQEPNTIYVDIHPIDAITVSHILILGFAFTVSQRARTLD